MSRALALGLALAAGGAAAASALGACGPAAPSPRGAEGPVGAADRAADRAGAGPDRKGATADRAAPAKAKATAADPATATAITAAAAAAAELAPPPLRLPDDVAPTAYRVRWDVDPDRDAFRGHVDIDVAIVRATDHVWLDAVGLTITAPSYTAGGAEHALVPLPRRTADVVGWRFAAPLPPGAATLHFDFAGALDAGDFAGLFREPFEGRSYLYSQFESAFARRAVPSFDEPRWKTPWTVTVAVPAGQQAFSNAPVRTVAQEADGKVAFAFEPTAPLPSYLVAIAAGPFEVVDAGTVGARHVPARVVVPAGHAADAAYAVRRTGDIVAALEAYFDSPLPLAKLDQVAVPRFFGAMENPGLITYQQAILLAPGGVDSEAFRHQFVWIAGHELAHQWFGDLVTLAWWDDLWLNESFATWMADKVGAELDPRWDPATRAADETEKAMQADAAADALPLRRDIHAVDEIENSFDAIAYEKGGAVLSMFEHWIGATRFRDGVRRYLADHAGGTATSDDFLRAMDAVAPADARAAFTTFLAQPGVPVVHVSLRCDAGRRPVLALRQARLGDASPAAASDAAATAATAATPAPWRIPVCARWFAADGTALPEACTLLGAATGELELPTDACPAAVDANAGGAGYYRVAYDDALAAALLGHLRALAPVERLALAGDTAALLRAGDAQIDDAVRLARALLGSDDPHAQLAAVELIAHTGDLVDDDHRAAWQRWVVAQLGARARARGLAPTAGVVGDADEIVGRAATRLLEVDGVDAADAKLGASARRLAGAWLAGRRVIDPDDLDLVLELAAVGGDAALFDRMLDAARAAADPDEADALAAALGSFRDPALVDRAFALVLDEHVPLRLSARALQALFDHAATLPRAWDDLRRDFDAVAPRLPGAAAGYLAYTPAGFCDADHRRDAEAFLAARVATLPRGKELLARALARVDRCIAARARAADAVARWLR